jgi:hypothetical protein
VKFVVDFVFFVVIFVILDSAAFSNHELIFAGFGLVLQSSTGGSQVTYEGSGRFRPSSRKSNPDYPWQVK